MSKPAVQGATKIPLIDQPTIEKPDNMVVVIMDKAGGMQTIQFVLDPHNLGKINALIALDNTDPHQLPSLNYKTLVNATKRLKGGHDNALVKDAAANQGGNIGNIGAAANQQINKATPAAPQPANMNGNIDTTALLQAFVASTTATQNMFTEVLNKLDRDRDVGRRGDLSLFSQI
ncbi:unnamed protein product [Rhizoctonia solani]|uniref:Uncharacterized protein n=1 Tax=Rhizoctonia solani TaxID=456999 RepID=A0A8H3BT19_9AGAM|nr:unnamed protein product [Rhizoctonia solani]